MTTTNYEKRQVAIWHQEAAKLQQMSAAANALGHDVIATGSSGCELVAHAFASPTTDLIITSVHLEDGDAIDRLIEIAELRPIPAIVTTERSSIADVNKALDDHVMAYLLEPVTHEELKATIHLVVNRFQEFMQLHDQVEKLEGRIKDMEVISRAKMSIMEQYKVGEKGAYEMLRKHAMNMRTKIADVAAQHLSGALL